MKKTILLALSLSALLHAQNSNVSFMMDKYSVQHKATDTKNTGNTFGIDARIYLIHGVGEVGEKVSSGPGASLSYSKIKYRNGDDSSLKMADLYIDTKYQINCKVSADILIGRTFGKSKSQTFDALLIGAGAKAIVSKEGITVGVDVRKNLHIDADKIPELDRESIYRYGLTVGYCF